MKIYRGLELFEAVMNYELRDGVKLRCIHSPVYGQGVEVDEREQILIWSDTKEPVDYSHFNCSQFEFKVIEEEKEIEKCKSYDEFEGIDDYIEHLKDQIDNLIDVINDMRDRDENND